MQENETTVNGKKLFYRTGGAGPAVVLLHGFGEDGTVWENQVGALQRDFRLIVPDLPGSGGSETIADMSMEGLAENVYALLQQLGVDEYAMIGHSMGGYVTLAFAEKRGERLNGFGLFHSTAYADSEEKKKTREKGIEFINQHGAAAFLETSIPNLFSEITKKEKPHVLQKLLEKAHNFSGAALVFYYRSMMQRPSRTAVLEKASVPVLFIFGRYDSAVPLQDGLQQCHLPELAHVHILEQSGHMGMLEEPEKATDALMDFLTQTTKHHPTT